MIFILEKKFLMAMIVSQSHHREEKFQKIIDFHKEFPETFSNNVTSPDFAKNR